MFPYLSSVADQITSCNPAKFSASVLSPAMARPGPGGRRGVARVHVEGMTCGKCVNFITTKVREVVRCSLLYVSRFQTSELVGVEEVVVSLEEKEAVVTYLATLTSPAQLATFIAGLADKFSTRTRAVNRPLRSFTLN